MVVAAWLIGALAVGFSLWRTFAFPVAFPFWDMIVVERFIEDGFALGWTLRASLRRR